MMNRMVPTKVAGTFKVQRGVIKLLEYGTKFQEDASRSLQYLLLQLDDQQLSIIFLT